MNNKYIIADIKSLNNNGKCTGHFFTTAHNYLSIFDNIQVAGGPIYRDEFSEDKLIQLPYDSFSSSSPISMKIHTILNARQLFKRHRNDIIILQQSGATTLFFCIWLFANNNNVIYSIQYDKSGVRGTIHKIIYRLSKKKIKGIICSSETVGEEFGLPYLVVPDYIYTKTDEPSSMPYEDKTYDICILGRINEDKGVVEIARSLSKYNYKVIIAGIPETKTIKESLVDINSKSEHIQTNLNYISTEEYKDYLHSSRFCILNYGEEYNGRSSGVVLDAIFNDVPVIAKKCMATDFVEDSQLGFCYNNFDDIDLSKIINKEFHTKCLDNIGKYKESLDKHKGRLREFIK